jgi:O-6-methylguanine DNA methyltransferase
MDPGPWDERAEGAAKMQRTATPLPWSRSVRLVRRTNGAAASGAESGSERVVELVDVGIPIDGVAAIEVEIALTGATRLLTGLRLVLQSPVDRDVVDRGASRTSRTSLAVLLEGLAGPDGVVPLGVVGSAFRCRVLTALAQVGAGTTVTYAELAARAGAPRAVRATASVMATNPLPLLLPCHRVVPVAGGIGRYAFGPMVKSALLALEAAGFDEAHAPRSVA